MPNVSPSRNLQKKHPKLCPNNKPGGHKTYSFYQISIYQFSSLPLTPVTDLREVQKFPLGYIYIELDFFADKNEFFEIKFLTKSSSI